MPSPIASSVNALGLGINPGRDASTPQEAARQFEAILVRQFVQTMTKGLFESSMGGSGMPSGQAGAQRDALVDALTGRLVETQALGLQELLLRQWGLDSEASPADVGRWDRPDTQALDRHFGRRSQPSPVAPGAFEPDPTMWRPDSARPRPEAGHPAPGAPPPASRLAPPDATAPLPTGGAFEPVDVPYTERINRLEGYVERVYDDGYTERVYLPRDPAAAASSDSDSPLNPADSLR